jgi:uncharacterized damage-inducible protein DinB
MDLLDQLLDHDDWATTTLLEASIDLTNEQLDQQFDIGHRTLRATYEHMIPNVAFWAGLMTGRPVDPEMSDRTVAEMIDDHKRFYAEFAATARRFRDEHSLDDTYLDHYGVRKSMGGTILMVVLHNTEHRTEVQHFLQRLGVRDVPEVDPGIWEYRLLNP